MFPTEIFFIHTHTDNFIQCADLHRLGCKDIVLMFNSFHMKSLTVSHMVTRDLDERQTSGRSFEVIHSEIV